MNIEEKRQRIHSSFIKKFGSKGKLQEKHLNFLLKEYNKEFFNGELDTKNITFQTKSISPFMAAYTITTNGKKQSTIVIDSYLLQNANYAQSFVGGKKCTDMTMCTLLLFEHELVHFIFHLRGEKYQVHGHNKRFLKAANELFGHSTYTTTIINEIIQRIDSQTSLQQQDQVWIRSVKNPSLEFMGLIKEVLPDDTYLVQSYTGEEMALGRKNLLFFIRKP
jgi:hypothetical protein